MAASKKHRKKPQRQPRKRWPKIVLAIAIVIAVLLLAYAAVFWLVQPPRPGAFYKTPENLPAERGVLLRSEVIDTDLGNADAYRVLYSSRDANNLPIAISGVVLVPHAMPPEEGLPVAAWAHGTSGIAPHCALSLEHESATEFAHAAAGLLDAGYIVVATDYPGLGTEGPHPYLIGTSEAYAVLDSVRTVSKHHAWNAGSQFALWGHSQGGHAVLFASQYAADYLPDMELVGTAAVAPATELSALLRDDIHTPVGKVFGSYALTSWSKLYPEAHLHDIVKPVDVPLAEVIAKDCLGTQAQGLVILPEVTLMSNDFLTGDPTVIEPWTTIIRQNSVAPEGIDTPLLILQGGDDTVIHPPISRQWARSMCQHTSNVTYTEYAGEDHMSVFTASRPDAQDWIEDRFANTAVAGNCANLPGS